MKTCQKKLAQADNTVKIDEALPGFLGTVEKRHLFQGNKSKKLKGTGEQRQFWGTENRKKFDFWEQGKMLIFSGDQGSRYPPPPTPHTHTPHSRWKASEIVQTGT